MDPETMRARLTAARVGRLATVTTSGRPHVVPCCFAAVGATIVSAVDGKPKSTLALRRLENVRANPNASLLVDHYADDWSTLWWVRVDGPAHVVEEGPERDSAVAALQKKYEQYRTTPPPGPVVVLEATQWRGWP
jgi:PPOX class probable F420-dependent enzyme